MPFPHVETDRIQSRPALIVATGLAGPLNLCWAMMITAAANPAWPEDVLVGGDDVPGLDLPSRVRVGKIAMIEPGIATPVGRLPGPIWAEVRARLAAILDLTA